MLSTLAFINIVKLDRNNLHLFWTSNKNGKHNYWSTLLSKISCICHWLRNQSEILMNFLVFKHYSLRLYQKKQHRNSNDEAFSVKKIRKHGKQSVYQPVLILCWCVTMTKRTVHAHVFMYIHMYVSMHFESYVQSEYMHVYTGYKYKILPIFIT